MLQFKTVHLNDVQLHYAEAPGSGPVLLIVHGLSGSHAEFLHLVPELARQAHVYLLDLRGHGRSGWAKSGYGIADYGRDVAAFLEQVVAQMPHCTHTVITDAGHDIHLDQLQAFLRELRQFLTAVHKNR